MAEILLEADHVGLAYHELDGETLAVEDIAMNYKTLLNMLYFFAFHIRHIEFNFHRLSSKF